MFDKDTLRALADQAITAAKVHITTSGSTLAVIPDTCKTVNLEPYQALRDRFRGKFATHTIAAFGQYVAHHSAQDSTPAGFINQDDMAATVIFNLGDTQAPGHGDDTATIKLKPTAAFSALQGIIQYGLSQQALAEWLEDWSFCLTAHAHSEPLGMPAAINAVRRMTIKASAQRDSVVGDFAASRSAMDEIEAKSLDTLPTQFIFSAPPYEGLSCASIPLRLSVITGNDEPVLKLRWVGEEAQREAFANEFKTLLTQEIGGFTTLTLGHFSIG